MTIVDTMILDSIYFFSAAHKMEVTYQEYPAKAFHNTSLLQWKDWNQYRLHILRLVEFPHGVQFERDR